MPTFTDLDPLTVELNSKNCDYLFNSLTSQEVPLGRNVGNQGQRDSFLRVYRLYLNLHGQYHNDSVEVERFEVSQENYRIAVIQAFHAQPYHNLPNLDAVLFTGFTSKEAQKMIQEEKNPTREHVYPRNRTLRLDLFDPPNPLSFREFICHYVSKGGIFTFTSSTENRRLRKYHDEHPDALETMHWREIYAQCNIEQHTDG